MRYLILALLFVREQSYWPEAKGQFEYKIYYLMTILYITIIYLKNLCFKELNISYVVSIFPGPGPTMTLLFGSLIEISGMLLGIRIIKSYVKLIYATLSL